jgi:alpha 1,2-mannosyltransferase
VLQFDPVTEYEDEMEDRPFFIHASWPPKLKPLRNVRDERQWGSEENSRTLFDGVDVESMAWGYMVEMACSEMLEFGDWSGLRGIRRMFWWKRREWK